MSDLQKDFIAALCALAPTGVTARVKPEWANTGSVYYQREEDFTTVLGVSYNFHNGYAGFNLTDVTDEERGMVGARSTASRPHGMSWIGWGYVKYETGELKNVLDGVRKLLAARTQSPESGAVPATSYLQDTMAEAGLDDHDAARVIRFGLAAYQDGVESALRSFSEPDQVGELLGQAAIRLYGR